MTTDGNQKELRLGLALMKPPADAPAKVVRQIDSEAQALAVSIAAGHHKLDYIAGVVGKSKPYISRMQNGERRIPHKLVGPLCAATGSNLLRQYLDMQRALEGQSDVVRLAQLLRAA